MDTIHGSVLTPRDQNLPLTLGLALRKRGKAEGRLCWINPDWKRNFPEPQESRGTLCPTLETNWAHKHSLCPCNTTQ